MPDEGEIERALATLPVDVPVDPTVDVPVERKS
jgi:hypothetical protein